MKNFSDNSLIFDVYIEFAHRLDADEWFEFLNDFDSVCNSKFNYTLIQNGRNTHFKLSAKNNLKLIFNRAALYFFLRNNQLVDDFSMKVRSLRTQTKTFQRSSSAVFGE